jgi:hypothetical protein
MTPHASLAERALAELDADPAVAALLHRAATAATEGELRALRGPWTAAVLRALRRAVMAGPAVAIRSAGASP